MMRILLDLIPLKSGGGQQVGVNLLAEIDRQRGAGHEWFVMATGGTQVAEALRDSVACQLAALSPGALGRRLWFERAAYPAILEEIRPDIIYSQFGTGLPRTSVPAVVGSAYSNLYYPEIDFWGNWPLHRRALYRIRDRFRLSRTLTADGWIFETDQIAERAKALYGLEEERVTVVRPSPSHAVQPHTVHSITADRCHNLPDGIRVLLLTGWHKNKSLDLLPQVAASLCLRGRKVTFVITVSGEHPYSRALIAAARRLGVADYFHFFGPVEPEGCSELYRRCDAVLLLSLLESFSNNIIESWTMERPLVISDAEWSRSICGPAAVYVDRRNPASIAKALDDFWRDPLKRRNVVRAGCDMRAQYPDSEAKLAEAVAFLERVRELGPRLSITK